MLRPTRCFFPIFALLYVSGLWAADLPENFQAAPTPGKLEQKEGWNITVFRLPEPRFENRAHGFDFRLFAAGNEIIVKKISLCK